MAQTRIMPVWTQPPPLSNGRDHLGMQAPSIALYSTLIPQITNVTKRIRYYSFYPWLCDQYARNRGDTSTGAWQSFVRRAEALLALACCANANGWMDGVAGINWAVRYWGERANAPHLDFASAATPGIAGGYLEASFGAFGQIYEAVLRELGIIGKAENHPIPVPGAGIGDDLAKAFSKSTDNAGAEFIGLLEKGVADPDTLKWLGEVFAPGAIPQDSQERTLLENVLFSGGNQSGIEVSARRESLLLCLTVADCVKAGINADVVRWVLYSQQLQDGRPLSVTDALLNRLRMWQAYQANELSHVAMESLLRLLLESMPAEPIAVSSAIELVVGKLLTGFERIPSSWRELRDGQSLSPNPSDLEAEGSEASLAKIVLNASDPASAAFAGIRLMAVLDKRWPGNDHSIGARFALGTPLRARFAQSVMGVLTYLRLRENAPFVQTITDLIQRLVLEQHFRIALRKLNQQGKRTFLFELIDGQLQKPLNMNPIYTNPRLTTSLSVLRDLYLLDTNGPTSRGRRLMEIL
jgi:hypothetical protein